MFTIDFLTNFNPAKLSIEIITPPNINILLKLSKGIIHTYQS